MRTIFVAKAFTACLSVPMEDYFTITFLPSCI